MTPMTEQIGMNWAWVIPALSAAAFFIVLPFRKRLPKQGAFVSILAIALGFALFWFALVDLLNAGPANLRRQLAEDRRHDTYLGRVG